MARSDEVTISMGRGLLLMAGLLSLSVTAVAETIYKSVDASGNVTYSNTPPAQAADVQEVAIPPAPSALDVQNALQDRQQLEQTGARLEQEREAKQTQETQALQAAEQALLQARIRWEQARTQTDWDWQYLQGGGRHLKDSYFQRAQNAEQALRAAEAAVANARR